MMIALPAKPKELSSSPFFGHRWRTDRRTSPLFGPHKSHDVMKLPFRCHFGHRP
jgi:hypothetical protein